MLNKSPGGSVFPYYYKGGEVHCLKYGSFFEKKDELFALMQAEEQFIAETNRKLKIWVDFYQTAKTKEVLLEFVHNLQRLSGYISKLSIVGFSASDRWRLRSALRKSGIELTMPLKFFSDPEDAKTWLVQEKV